MTKGLTLTVHAEDDLELRNYVKVLIRGQVTTIMREILGDIVKEEMQKAMSSRIEEFLQKAVAGVLGGKSSQETYIKETVRFQAQAAASGQIREILEKMDLDKLIEEAVLSQVAFRVRHLLETKINTKE